MPMQFGGSMRTGADRGQLPGITWLLTQLRALPIRFRRRWALMLRAAASRSPGSAQCRRRPGSPEISYRTAAIRALIADQAQSLRVIRFQSGLLRDRRVLLGSGDD